jgi:hypothetical protein
MTALEKQAPLTFLNFLFHTLSREQQEWRSILKTKLNQTPNTKLH